MIYTYIGLSAISIAGLLRHCHKLTKQVIGLREQLRLSNNNYPKDNTAYE